MAHESHAKALPADLSAPVFVGGWQTTAFMVGAVFSIIAVILAFLGRDQLGWDHFLAGRLAAWRCSWCSMSPAVSGGCFCAGLSKP